jgi:murein DD-endopeptidase MepM/ murein hydrolase activator NlpD
LRWEQYVQGKTVAILRAASGTDHVSYHLYFVAPHNAFSKRASINKLILALLFCLFCSFDAFAAQNYPFRIHSIKTTNQHLVTAINDGPATITVVVNVTGSNYKSDRRWPVIDVIAPHSPKQLGWIQATNPQSGYSFSTNFNYGFGDVNKISDGSFSYRIPFPDGFRSHIIQAPGGQITTHNLPHSTFAIDFSAPENTPIVAARSGTVVSVEDSFTQGGLRQELLDKANMVEIQHSDGTIASYVHLAPKKAAVRVGQTVSAGELIGFSGNTGYSGGPHLHFGLTRVVVGPDNKVIAQSLPVSFFVHNPPVRIEMQQGMMVVADYSSPLRSVQANPQISENHTVRMVKPEQSSTIQETRSEKDASHIVVTLDLSWLDEIERRTGHPWWMWSGLLLLALICLKIVISVFSSSGEKPYRIEPGNRYDDL